MPHDGAHDGQTGAGVAAREFHDRLAGAEPAVSRRLLDHAQGDAVLLRAARVEVVELGHDPSRAGMEAANLDEGVFTDGTQHRVEQVRHRTSRGTRPTLPAMFDPDLTARAQQAAELLKARGDTIGVAE